MSDLFEKRLEEVTYERDVARSNLAKAEAKLQECENRLKYYADPRSYSTNHDPAQPGLVFQNRCKDDFTKVDPLTHVAGRRAREYFSSFYDTASDS